MFFPASSAEFAQRCHRVVTNVRGNARKRRLAPALVDVSRARGGSRLLLLDDHRLDGRDDAVLDLDLDHAGADGPDRLLEVDLAAIDGDPAGVLDGVDDVLRGHRAEEAPVV